MNPGLLAWATCAIYDSWQSSTLIKPVLLVFFNVFPSVCREHGSDDVSFYQGITHDTSSITGDLDRSISGEVGHGWTLLIKMAEVFFVSQQTSSLDFYWGGGSVFKSRFKAEASHRKSLHCNILKAQTHVAHMYLEVSCHACCICIQLESVLVPMVPFTPTLTLGI